MSLEIQINNDIKKAMLAKDKKTLEALRAIKAGLLLIKTGGDIHSEEIPDAVGIQLLQKLVKQRKESALMYSNQNRKELAEEELFQAGIIEKYLPEQLSEEELKSMIAKIIAEAGASSMKDMGKVMGLASKALEGKADNKTVSAIVKELLG
ncbi:MAG: GatB/YqeY domain-containing protein [Bacteroidales bacterium]|nr:GatB/YqeY domain-containing protein [Bacteroidales bacterium]